MRKFLVVNMNYLGDALLTTPALAALRRAYPDAQIDTVAGSGPAAEVLRGNPDINTVISRTANKSWGRCVQIHRLLRAGRYTDAIILPPLPAYALTAFLAGTRTRVGAGRRGMDACLTRRMPSTARHMADAMLETVDVPPLSSPYAPRLSIGIDPEAASQADQVLRAHGIDPDMPLIAVNLGATRPQKRWFADAFAELIDLLAGTQTVLIGAGQHDVDLAAQVLAAVKVAQPINLVGKTTVKQLAAVLARCSVVVTADSGPMHLATAVGTPVVALFGSTDPAVTGPYDGGISHTIYKALPCAPCFNHPTCDGRFDCMRSITAAEVAVAARAFLRERRLGPDAKLPMIDSERPHTNPLPEKERGQYPRIGPTTADTLESPPPISPANSVKGDAP